MAHHIGSLRSGTCINLAGRCLDEVGTRIHRENRSNLDVFSSFEQSGFENHLQVSFGVAVASRLLNLCYFIGYFFIRTIHKVAYGEHDVHFVGAIGYGEGGFHRLHLEASLRRWEIGRANGDINVGSFESFAHHFGKLRVYADGSHIGIFGIIVFKIVHALSESSHRAFAVIGAESGKVDAIEHHLIHILIVVLSKMSGKESLHLSLYFSIVGNDFAIGYHFKIFVIFHIDYFALCCY